jgi:hypothetical protein
VANTVLSTCDHRGRLHGQFTALFNHLLPSAMQGLFRYKGERTQGAKYPSRKPCTTVSRGACSPA